jgi:DNA-binding HxlR family transcriptional regulator
MKVTTKARILSYLKYRSWVSGSELENQAEEWLTKPSIVARRVSELAHDGLVERSKNDRKRVQYRLPVRVSTIQIDPDNDQAVVTLHAIPWMNDD